MKPPPQLGASRDYNVDMVPKVWNLMVQRLCECDRLQTLCGLQHAQKQRHR